MAADSIPLSVSGLSPRAQDIYRRVKSVIDTEILPREAEFQQWSTDPNTKWQENPFLEELQKRCRSEGLWNLAFTKTSPGSQYGAGLTNVEYAFICEQMGRCQHAPAVFNCGAPGVPDMEIFIRFGTEEQKRTYLEPMLRGEIASCFGMTEPAVASSDATNIASTIERQGDHYVINGHKWWISGVMKQSCKFCLFMGKTGKGGGHQQHSIVIIPINTPGFKVLRHTTVFGYDDAPHAHCELLLENVKVPVSNLIHREGGGFEVAQGRLAAARTHHCIRLIGNAECALQLMVDRAQNRVAFGKPLASYGSVQQDIAKSRIEIEMARLLMLKASHKMDTVGSKAAMPLISMLKVVVPSTVSGIIDRAIQIHGGMGVCQDTPLPKAYTYARFMRIADGPDEVHRQVIARHEFRNSKL